MVVLSKSFKEIFGTEKPIIGMVHFPPLPGTPLYDERAGVDGIIDWVKRDLLALQEGGIDAVMFGNEGDRPYELKVDTASIATMSYVIGRIRDLITVPFGVDVLWDPRASIAVAAAVGAKFVREVFTNVYASDMGLWNPNAAEALRYRRFLGIDHVLVFYNINAEFAAPLAERPVELVARSVVFSSLADAICLSGPMTGEPVTSADLKRVKGVIPNVPVIANTGVRVDNVAELLEIADGAIVGTSLKIDGNTWNPVDPQRVKEFMRQVQMVRQRTSV